MLLKRRLPAWFCSLKIEALGGVETMLNLGPKLPQGAASTSTPHQYPPVFQHRNIFRAHASPASCTLGVSERCSNNRYGTLCAASSSSPSSSSSSGNNSNVNTPRRRSSGIGGPRTDLRSVPGIGFKTEELLLEKGLTSVDALTNFFFNDRNGDTAAFVAFLKVTPFLHRHAFWVASVPCAPPSDSEP
jgi:hypothetical protein